MEGHPAAEARPYIGLAAPGQAEIVIRKSRFLGFAWPAPDVETAEAGIERLREEHREARHVCFAYRVGLEREEVRSSDDGEPSGTAGRPILEVLVQRDIRDAAVAVVRYFGGVLLGAPGLVRAYSQVAAAALDAARSATMVPHMAVDVSMPYPLLDRFRHLVAEVGGIEEGAQYGEDVRLTLFIASSSWSSFSRRLESFGGQLTLTHRPGVHYRPES